MVKQRYNFAVDFDGTVITHEYPRIGKDIGAVPVLKALVEQGHSLITNTMRSGKSLDEAIKWFYDNGIELYGIQNNPTQGDWTTSPKIYADIYIDDAALGAPLKFDSEISSRPFIDWVKVEEMLKEQNIL